MGQAQSSQPGVTKAEWDAWKGTSTSVSSLPYINQSLLDSRIQPMENTITGFPNTYVKKTDQAASVVTEKLNIGKFGLIKQDDTHICLAYDGAVRGCIDNAGIYTSGASASASTF